MAEKQTTQGSQPYPTPPITHNPPSHPPLHFISPPPPVAEKQTTQGSQELELSLQSELSELNLELARAKERNITVSGGRTDGCRLNLLPLSLPTYCT